MKKIGQFSETYISETTKPIFFKLVCNVMYMEGIEYLNLIEIDPVVTKI